MLFCCKNGLFPNFALFSVILMTFKLVNCLFLLLKEKKLVFNHIVVASIDVWQSYFAHSFCKIHFMLFCCKFTFLAIYSLFWVK